MNLIENEGSSWATNVIIHSLSSLHVRNFCEMEISMSPTTLRTRYRCWSYFEIEKRFFLPWKWNPRAGWMWKKTWSMHYHVLSIEYLCFQTTNRHNLHIDCSARCVIKCCLYICLMHVQQLPHWRNCTVGGPRTLCLLINWATCLKRLRNPALEEALIAKNALCWQQGFFSLMFLYTLNKYAHPWFIL